MVGTNWFVLWFLCRVAIEFIILKKYSNRKKSRKESEVVFIIDCEEAFAEMVTDTLWSNHAPGVSKSDHINI
jgi:hypothetical protein